MRPFASASIARVFSAYPASIRPRLVELRELIFSAAETTPGVGAIEETLKWAQPSYVTSETKSGSTIRIDAIRDIPEGYAMYFHCQTTLVETFKKRFGRKFSYQGNRALVFHGADELPRGELRECIAEALTYHLRKKEGDTADLKSMKNDFRKGIIRV